MDHSQNIHNPKPYNCTHDFTSLRPTIIKFKGLFKMSPQRQTRRRQNGRQPACVLRTLAVIFGTVYRRPQMHTIPSFVVHFICQAIDRDGAQFVNRAKRFVDCRFLSHRIIISYKRELRSVARPNNILN